MADVAKFLGANIGDLGKIMGVSTGDIASIGGLDIPADGGIDAYTKFMLHMDGANNGTVFTDSSASAHVITRDSVVTKTGTKKFGTASGFFNGVAHNLSADDHADFDFGTGPFTIDFWVYSPSVADAFGDGLVSAQNTYEGAGWCVWRKMEENHFWFSYIDDHFNAGALTLGTWQHLAVVRNANNLSMYINGVSGLSQDITGLNINSWGNDLVIGKWAGLANDSAYTGYIEEVRISKGIARWTEGFDVPTEAYS